LSKYIVALDVDPASHRETEALVDSQSLYRDRRVFSKILLRAFLKASLTKEQWHGAPWTVRPKLAKEFNIPTEVPPHLQQTHRMAEKKAMAAQKKANEAEPTTFMNFLASKQRPLEVRPSPKGQKHRFIQQDISRYMAPTDPQYAQFQQMHPQMHQMQFGPGGQMQMMQQSQLQQFGQPNRAVPAHNFHSNQFQPISTLPFSTAQMMHLVPSPPPPPPIKFPTEDLDVPPRTDTAGRPSLKFFAKQASPEDVQENVANPKLESRVVGPLLEIWNTLNVLGEVFVLDSFTLDDLAEAVQFSSQEIECELLTEVHCAVLKQIVDQKGEIQPDMPEFDESEDEEDEEEPDDASEDPSPEPEAPRRTTRSSLAKAEAKAMKERSSTPEQKQLHRAQEMIAERPWVERLKERDFKDGGWQTILVGILDQMTLEPRKKDKCEMILKVLAPMDQDATDEVARFQYNELEPSLRIDALEMIVMLAVGTPAIRGHLETMSLQMTELRKKKIEQQRLRKDL
jgi:hypothetical protein